MRRSVLATLALTLMACEGGPLGHKWQVGDDGKAIPGTQVPVWTEDEVAELRQALVHNVAYNVDCGTVRNPRNGEVLLFDGQNYTAECNAIRVRDGATNPPQNLAIQFTDPTARWKSGKSWNDQVSSLKGKYEGVFNGRTLGQCIRLRQNAAGGDSPGWGSALWQTGSSGTINVSSLGRFADASFIVVEAKGFDVPGCSI